MNDVPPSSRPKATASDVISAYGTQKEGFRGNGESRRGDLLGLVLAWLAILIGIVLWVWTPGGDPSEDALEAEVPSGLLLSQQDEMVGKLAFGMQDLSSMLPPMQQAEMLSTGGVAQRTSYAILEAELIGIDQAREELESILAESGDDPVTLMLLPAVTAVFDALDAGEAAPVASTELLEERLGWFGRLASAMGRPDEMSAIKASAKTGMMTFLAGIGLMFIAGLLGFVGLIVLLVFGFTGRIASKVFPVTRHGVYAETFAIWLLLMLLLQMLASFLVDLLSVEGMGLLASIMAFFLSLAVLAWPVFRGIEWRTVRKDIGLERPRLLDIPTGVASWAMALPFLFLGAFMTVVLTLLVQFLTNETPQPEHPAQQAAMTASGWGLFQLFLLASVAAPVVEEIMFRGVLFSHLRGAMRRWAVPLGIVLSAIISSVIFAAIHPQGFVFIPPLAGLGIGFCIAREWRGSVVPAMVAHGVSNALVMSLNVFLFGG